MNQRASNVKSGAAVACSALLDRPFVNQNPRIGVLLKQCGASVRLYNVLNPRFGMRGLNWLRKYWPEERLRKEVPGYGEAVSLEWNLLLTRRMMRELRNHVIEHHSSRVMTPDVCPCCSRGVGKRLMDRVDVALRSNAGTERSGGQRRSANSETKKEPNA